MKIFNKSFNTIRIFAVCCIILGATLFISCERIEREAKVETGTVSDITINSAKVTGIMIDRGDGVLDYGHCWSLTSNPTTDNFKTSASLISDNSFTSNLTGLSGNTTYYVRAYATNSEVTVYGDQVSFTTSANNITFNPDLTYGSVTDIDGNVYKTVQIGTQKWMAENLKTTRYQNGSSIIQGTTNDDWNNANWGLYVNYNNDPEVDADYGKLYNWFAVADSRNICPTGWHVPTNNEWRVLNNYLISGVAGGKMKETGIIHWDSPNTGATNESGFTALPGGLRTTNNFTWEGRVGFWWSSTHYYDPEWPEATGYQIFHDFDDLYEDNAVYIKQGLSVRCIEGPPVITIPYVRTSEVVNISSTSATCGGLVNSEGYGSVTSRGICWSSTENPTISENNTTSDGSGSGDFTSQIAGLIANTTYYVRAYATNNLGTAYGNQVSFTTLDPSKVADVDGNIYSIITIGTQVWMAENLKTTRYNDGSSIPSVTGNADWSNLATPGYCWYENNATTYKNVYGALYNWYAVNTGKLCPSGWHVASDNDWTTLTNYLEGESVAGGKLKATGTFEGGDGLWHSPNTGATNEEGFTALPGGYRLDSGIFEGIGLSGNWWTSSEASSSNAWTRGLDYDLPYCYRYNGHSKKDGYSVRCIRD